MRKAIQVSVLALALSISAYAGEMQCGVTDPPPPPTTSAVQEPTTDGEMECGLTEIALTLLNNLLPIL
jgi:hypothetical protein